MNEGRKFSSDVGAFLDFILMTEKLKMVERRTSVVGSGRRETSAEHSWQVALLAMVLKDKANKEVDIQKVIMMLLIHDLPEALVGDTFFYSKDREGEGVKDLFEKEKMAAKEIFSKLPSDMGDYLLELWKEYEARETDEAKFAHAINRIIPPLQNYYANGGTWKEFSVSLEVAKSKNEHVKEGSQEISEFVYEVLEVAGEEELFY
jgi:putative hydrolase of HD superfamily